jgi:all-trans-retinol dehydrogenase (NAD+)
MRLQMQDATVLITGAAAGMGKRFALKAAQSGAANIIVWDIDPSGLQQVCDEITQLGATPHPFIVDMASRQAIETTASLVQQCACAKDLTLIINNAGVVRGKYFWEHDNVQDTEWIMAINALAPMYVTKAFLPQMMANAQQPCRILTVASAVATMANPKMSVYAASKWAVFGWSDSLRLELEQAGYAHIRVTTFCPSYISTGMFAGVRQPFLTPVMHPDVAVEAAWAAMLSGKAVLYKPWTVSLARALRGILPTCLWDALATHVFGIYRSMQHFTGHTKQATANKKPPANHS